MSTSFFSLIFAGVVGVGTFAGTLQQNLSHPQAPEIDLLFKEIEEDIREFSRENPITKKDVDKIKEAGTSSTDVTLKRRKRNIDTNEEKNFSYTLEAWVYIWVQLVSNYIDKLWKNKPEAKRKHPIIFTPKEIKKALEDSEQTFQKEKQEFEKILSESLKGMFERIYKKMKEFTLLTNLPKDYQTANENYPYEHHIKEILEKSG